MSIAFLKSFSKTAAKVAMTRGAQVKAKAMAPKPGASSKFAI